jgi:hypothetical protein
MELEVSRRSFTKQTLGSLLAYSLLETLAGHDVLADEVRPVMGKWLLDLEQLGQSVKGRKLKQTQWQTKVEELYAKVDLKEVLRLIDFDRLSKDVKFLDQGARSLGVKLPEVEGLPRQLVFGRQIFALKKDRSVIPHGHNNMATAFLILQGDLRGRHYDRLEDEKDHFIIKPTIDRKFSPGECSTISDYKDNIHWFQALTDTAFIFNIHVMGVNDKPLGSTGRLYLNPNGEKLSEGRIRAPRISYEQANKMFG